MSNAEAPTYPEYAGLRAMAQESVRCDGRFVDPVKLRMRQCLRRPLDWTISVLGYDHGSVTLLDMHMLLLADGQDITPPLPSWLAELRAGQAADRLREEQQAAAELAALDGEWQELYEALPVPVTVAYNYSGPNHLESWCQGAVHILVGEELRAGRLYRTPGQALCTTPSSAKHQEFADAGDPPENRRATCKTCIRLAGRVTGKSTVLLLAQR